MNVPTHDPPIPVLILESEDDTDRLGAILASLLPAHCVVALNGTLGAGKTRLVQAFASACGVAEKDITSPTFTLWQTYHGSRTIHHLDAYRIRDEDEFDQLGVYECFDDEVVVFVEWADRVRASLPDESMVRLQMEVVTENSREVKLSATTPALTKILEQVLATYLGNAGSS